VNELRSEFDWKAGCGSARGEDAATDATASFEQDDAQTGFGEFAGSSKSGDASSENDNVNMWSSWHRLVASNL
jgi:hypothetical protein